jgi:iron complex transport system substrate-binding protein
MKLIRKWIFLLFFIRSLPVSALEIIDDVGALITFTSPPQRIISLAPNLTELAFAAGMGSHMVAVSAYSDFPAAAQKLPQVGDAFRLNWEQLLALKPDLILAWGSGLSAQDRAAFEKLKLKFIVLEPRRLDDIPRILRMLGKIAATSAAVEIAAQDFEQQRVTLHQKYQNKNRVRAYFQISATPLLTISGAHIISDVLQLCGARNVFSDTPMLVTTISDEALVQAQPQIMLGIATTKNQEIETGNAWRKLPVHAARLGKIGFVHPDIISRATPRILLGASQICT